MESPAKQPRPARGQTLMERIDRVRSALRESPDADEERILGFTDFRDSPIFRDETWRK